MIYHIYNRGAHKAPIFHDSHDYQRFLHLLYIGNNIEPLKFRDYVESMIFTMERKTTFIDILAYCLMPNHFHIVIKEDRENAATEFMRKICTSYSMYYNLKYKHSGTIFQGGLKKKFVEDERYLATLINYVHLNPYGIENPNVTKEMKYENMTEARRSSAKYEYSSYKDYLGESRPQGSILRY